MTTWLIQRRFSEKEKVDLSSHIWWTAQTPSGVKVTSRPVAWTWCVNWYSLMNEWPTYGTGLPPQLFEMKPAGGSFRCLGVVFSLSTQKIHHHVSHAILYEPSVHFPSSISWFSAALWAMWSAGLLLCVPSIEYVPNLFYGSMFAVQNVTFLHVSCPVLYHHPPPPPPPCTSSCVVSFKTSCYPLCIRYINHVVYLIINPPRDLILHWNAFAYWPHGKLWPAKASSHFP